MGLAWFILLGTCFWQPNFFIKPIYGWLKLFKLINTWVSCCWNLKEELSGGIKRGHCDTLTGLSTVTPFLVINNHFDLFNGLKFACWLVGSPYNLLFRSQGIVNDLFEELKFVKQKNGQGGRGGRWWDPLTIYRSIFHPTPPSP